MTMAADDTTGGAPSSSSSSSSSSPAGVLKKKVAGFPVQTWLLLIGGGAALGLYLRSRNAKKAAPAPAGTDAAGLEAAPIAGPASQGNNALGTPGLVTSDKPTTNLAWENLAINLLIGQGQDPAMVQSAIGKFLNGQPLTTQERALVSLAIRLAGAPPEGAPPASSDPTPAAPSTPTVPAAPPGAPGTPSSPQSGPVDAYPGTNNLTLIETANDLFYRAPASADFAAMRDSLAVRVHAGTLCGTSAMWNESQDPGQPELVIKSHVGARMAQLGWTPKC
jgi:hypothetical protein